MKKKVLSALLSLVLCLAVLTAAAAAAGGFVIEDGADLLTDAEEAALTVKYAGLAEYMDVAVVTTNSSAATARRYAEDYAVRNYGTAPAVIFLIDMDNREIYVCSNRDAIRTVSNADGRAITDNIYQYASRGDYYTCTDKALEQIQARFQGERLARPVKHITNALIAVLFGVLINYFVVVRSRRSEYARRTTGKIAVNVSRQMAVMPGIALAAPIVIDTVKRYKESSSGHSGRSGGGGFGGGGGGFSGGGGGHKF